MFRPVMIVLKKIRLKCNVFFENASSFYSRNKIQYFFHLPLPPYSKKSQRETLSLCPLLLTEASSSCVPVFSYRFPPDDGYNLGEWSGWGGGLSVPPSSTHYQMFRGRSSLHSLRNTLRLCGLGKEKQRRRWRRELTSNMQMKITKRRWRFFTVLSKQARENNNPSFQGSR